MTIGCMGGGGGGIQQISHTKTKTSAPAEKVRSIQDGVHDMHLKSRFGVGGENVLLAVKCVHLFVEAAWPSG